MCIGFIQRFRLRTMRPLDEGHAKKWRRLNSGGNR
jgi:hypothetical protein